MRSIVNLRKQRKTNKGITLITLVITIIVLLILAGISIATLTGENGLLKKSENAKEETRGASVEEAKNLWKMNQKADNYSESGKAETLEELIDDLVEQKLLTEDEKDEILGNTSKGIEATGQITIGSRTIVFKDYIEVGDYVDYDPTVSDKNGTPVDAEGIPENERKLVYKSPKGTSKTHGNGNSEQKFTATKNTKWRVLSIENGTVELISEDVIKTDAGENFILEGAIGYLYAEQELNEVCKIFGYGYGADPTKGGTYTTGGPKDTPITGKIEGTGARSITIEDINKKAGIYKDTDGKMKYSDGTVIDSKYGSTSNPTINVYYPTASTSNGSSSSAGIKKIKYTYCAYYRSGLKNNCINDMFLNGSHHWIASRCFNAGPNVCDFRLHCVYGSFIGAETLCYGNDSYLCELESPARRAVRPVVTLKSDVIDISSNCNSENGWKLK